jgi:hypothetical protein
MGSASALFCKTLAAKFLDRTFNRRKVERKLIFAGPAQTRIRGPSDQSQAAKKVLDR